MLAETSENRTRRDNLIYALVAAAVGHGGRPLLAPALAHAGFRQVRDLEVRALIHYFLNTLVGRRHLADRLLAVRVTIALDPAAAVPERGDVGVDAVVAALPTRICGSGDARRRAAVSLVVIACVEIKILRRVRAESSEHPTQWLISTQVIARLDVVLGVTIPVAGPI